MSAKTTLYLIIALFSFILSGCELVTQFEEYDIQYSLHSKQKESTSETEVQIGIKPTMNLNYSKIPFLFGKSIKKGPYKFYVRISGQIDGFEPVKAYFIINNSETIFIDILLEEWKVDDISNHEKSIVIPDRELNYDWEKINSIEFHISYYTTLDKEKGLNKARLYFSPILRKNIGNRVIRKMMSV